MKKLFLVAVAGLLFAANSNAQVQREMPQHRHMQSDSSVHFQRGKRMHDLNLTADQQTQMKSLHKDMMQQRKVIQKDATLSTDQKKEKMKELHKTQMQKVNTILTPDQQAKMKAFRQEGKQNHQSSKQMMRQIDLTSNQQAQMKALHETMLQQRNAIQNDATLSTDQKKEKMKELHKIQRQKVNSILTPDQQAKMKTFREQRKQNHKMQKNQSEQS